MKVGTHKNTHFDTQTSEKKSTRSNSNSFTPAAALEV